MMTAIENARTFVQATPWIVLAVFAVPLIVLSYRKIFPSRPLIGIAVAPCLLSFGVLIRPDALFLVILADAVLVVVSVIDLLSLPRMSALEVSRDALRIASINMNHHVALRLSNVTARTFDLSVKDDCPQEFEATPNQFDLRLTGRKRAMLEYEMKSHERGAFTMRFVHVRVSSRWRLWNRLFSYPCQSIVNVYPDMKQMSEYAILARTNRLSLVGVRRTRRIGQDNEFERLRDYTLDDNYKHIDWRTTARRNKLTVKDYQTNQSQRIIFMLDCGRMMTNEANSMSLLDHSLNAMLMLAFVALRQGDNVGLICFSDRIHNFIPPRGGMKQMNQLLHASFDRFPSLVESRYDEAFLYLATHCKKRSLVVLVSNVIDEVNAIQIQEYLTNLVGRHLPVGVLLRDHGLFDAVEPSNITPESYYRAAAAADILAWRKQILTDLQHKGVLSLDVFPENLTAPLVNSYLDIKARHLL